MASGACRWAWLEGRSAEGPWPGSALRRLPGLSGRGRPRSADIYRYIQPRVSPLGRAIGSGPPETQTAVWEPPGCSARSVTLVHAGDPKFGAFFALFGQTVGVHLGPKPAGVQTWAQHCPRSEGGSAPAPGSPPEAVFFMEWTLSRICICRPKPLACLGARGCAVGMGLTPLLGTWRVCEDMGWGVPWLGSQR